MSQFELFQAQRSTHSTAVRDILTVHIVIMLRMYNTHRFYRDSLLHSEVTTF